MYLRQKPSSWWSCSPACGSSCVSREVEASIREKVSLPILRGKVSLQSPNLIDCRSCVGRKASHSEESLLLQISKSSKRSSGRRLELGNNSRGTGSPTAETFWRRYFHLCDRCGINRRFQKVHNVRSRFQRLGA